MTEAIASGPSSTSRTVLSARAERRRRVDERGGDEGRSGSQARWLSIEVRHLAALAAVARVGSFRRAAEDLGYVQSAISGQIAHLEQVVGARLLERASGTPLVSLTDAGRVLLSHIDEILARFEAASADVGSLAARSAGVVRVAGLEELGSFDTAKVLSLFRRRHPFARVLIEEPAEPSDTRPALGALDLLVYEATAARATREDNVLRHDGYVLLVPRGSKLAARTRAVTGTELAELRPIIPSQSLGSEVLRMELAEHGIERHPRWVPETVAMAEGLVADGLGAALVSTRSLGEGCGRTVALDLSHLLTPAAIALDIAAERAEHPVVEAMAQIIREVCGEQSSEVADACADNREPSRALIQAA